MNKRPIILCIAIVVSALLSVFPFFASILTSIIPETELAAKGALIIPERFTAVNYVAIFGAPFNIRPSELPQALAGDVGAIPPGFFSSLVTATAASVIAIALATLGGYAFGRIKFPAKTPLLVLLLFTRMLPPITVIIPLFGILQQIGLVGTYQGIILTHVTLVVPLLTWVLMGYFATLPLEAERAAKIDGCGRWSTFRYVILPMGRSGIVATWIIGFVISWNDLLFAYLVTAGSPVLTIQPAILNMSPLGPIGTSGWGIISAVMLLSVLPPLVLVLIFQRFVTRLNIVDPVTVIR